MEAQMNKYLNSDSIPEKFVKDFKGYSPPTRKDAAVLVCHFSPAKFRRPSENARQVVRDMRAASIPVFSIELSHSGREELEDPTLRVSSESIMFHKENLLNILVPHVPREYSKLIFLDADVRFSCNDWLDRASALLDSKDVIQPMEWCFWSSAKRKISAAEQINRGGRLDVGNTHPGFATGVRRDWFDRVGGLYDKAVIGNGDLCFWHAVAGDLGFDEEQIRAYTAKYEDFESYASNVRKNPAKVGSVIGCFAGHMPHGLSSRRMYLERQKLLRGDISVEANNQGVYEWRDKSRNPSMLSYFQMREEDNLTDLLALSPHMDDQTLEFFREKVKCSKTYVEYGCGGSTVLAFNESEAKIVCVESDASWLKYIKNFMPGELSRLEARRINLGRVGEWGCPISKEVSGEDYASWPWTRTNSADLILVDGRYRIACFIKSVLNCAPGAVMIFDDYADITRGYKAVEKVMSPERIIGRSAIFTVPVSFDRSLAESMLEKAFKDPM